MTMNISIQHRNLIEQGLELLKAWEFNGRGLVYMPQGGDWGDEYFLHGYALLVQVLRWWAQSCYSQLSENKVLYRESIELKDRIRRNYFLRAESVSEQLYHPKAAERHLATHGDSAYLLAGFTPGRYYSQFDFLSNAIAVLSGLSDQAQSKSIVGSGQRIVSSHLERSRSGFLAAGCRRYARLERTRIELPGGVQE